MGSEHEHGHDGHSHSDDRGHHGGETHRHGGDPRDHDHDLGHHHPPHQHSTGPLGVIKGIFAPHSHDSADKVDSVLESSARGIHASKVSLAIMMVTGLVQVGLLVVTGSVALFADTVHHFGDGLTSVPVWIAFVVGRRAANARFTYGYRRAEDLAGMFVLVMIFASAALAFWESIDRLVNPVHLQNLGWLALAGLIGFLGNEIVALLRMRVGTSIGSAALVADGYHARTDGLTSLGVLFGAIGVWFGFDLADPIVGLLITVVILMVLRTAAGQMFARLMDAVDPALTEAVERAAQQPGVQEVTSVRVRWVGHRLEAEAHVTVDCDLTTLQSHAIAETVRHAICHNVRRIADVVVHVDPCAHGESDPHATTARHVPPSPRPLASTAGARRS